jgi:5-methylthioadenosine/S-adenosylhomocysteine deaminase
MPGRYLLQAKIILSLDKEPLINGGLLVENGRIKDLISESECRNLSEDRGVNHFDLGPSVIVPGLINLHTHIEYSYLNAHQTSKAFFPWVRSLIEETSLWTAENWQGSAEFGAKLAAQAGTTCIVDGSYSGLAARAASKQGLRALVGLELFGVDEASAGEQWRQWLTKLEAAKERLQRDYPSNGKDGNVKFTVAPHAPYTVCPSLWSRAQKWAAAEGQKLLAHVSETENERRWFDNGDNLVDDHLNFAFGRVGFKQSVLATKAWRKSGQTPVKHLAEQGLLDGNLLAAHVVQASEADIELLSANLCSLAHCPRSNSRLRNGIAPLALIQEKSVPFGLGTDSLASCDDLNLLNEARFAIGLHRAVDPSSKFDARAALAAITIDSARAIGWDSEIGSLAPGKSADLAIFQVPPNLNLLPDNLTLNAYDLLIHGGCQWRSTFVAGRTIAGQPLLAGSVS